MTDPAIPAGTGVQITVGGFIRSPCRVGAPSGEGDGNPRLVAAAQAVLDTAQDYYTARNGRRCSIEGSDGEKCWIVPFDQFEDLRRAALAQPEAGGER